MRSHSGLFATKVFTDTNVESTSPLRWRQIYLRSTLRTTENEPCPNIRPN
jgi:hypothetical protein